MYKRQVSGYGDTFRMARILGVDEDTGARVCHGRWPVQAEPVDGLIPDGATLKTHDHLYMTDGGTRVLAGVGRRGVCIAPAAAVDFP